MGILDGFKKQNKVKDDYKSEKLYIRVTPEEKELIQRLSKCQSLNLSNFVRWVIFCKFKNEFINDLSK